MRQSLFLFSNWFMLLALVTGQHSPSLLEPAVHQISPGVFSCKSSNPIKRQLCDILLGKLNAELQSAGISITKNDILFTYNNGRHEHIDTGHSCSVRAQLRNRHAEARLQRSASLKVQLPTLQRPLTIAIKLPVSLSGELEIRKRFGLKVFRKCNRIGSDTFRLRGSLSTQARALLGFALNPTLRVLPSGDYELAARPSAIVMFELQSTNIRFRVSGLSFLSAIWTKIVAFRSTIGSSLSSLVRGRSLKSVWKKISRNAAFDFGAPIALGLGSLPGPLERTIFKAFGKVIARVLEKKAKGFGSDLEDKLNAEIRRALKTDASGRRVIIIKRDFIKLLHSTGPNADIFLKPKPAVRQKPRRRLRGCRGSQPCLHAME